MSISADYYSYLNRPSKFSPTFEEIDAMEQANPGSYWKRQPEPGQFEDKSGPVFICDYEQTD